MASLSQSVFTVNDDGGGASTRTFTFTTLSMGNAVNVSITYDGGGMPDLVLSATEPIVSLPVSPARVKPTGTLKLLWDNTEATKMVVFTGTLETTHTTTVNTVCIGAVD